MFYVSKLSYILIYAQCCKLKYFEGVLRHIRFEGLFFNCVSKLFVFLANNNYYFNIYLLIDTQL